MSVKDRVISPICEGFIFTKFSELTVTSVRHFRTFIAICFSGKDDIFGGDVKEPDVTGKSLYIVRALTYCDINKIELVDLKETLNTYPEFAQEFMDNIQVTFNLKRVSKYYLTFWLM